MAKRLGGEVRREQIVEAALTLAAGGLKEVTVQKVARLVGVVPSALYRHYPNKDAILMAVLDQLEHYLTDICDQAEAEAGDPLESIKRVMLLHARLATERRGVPRVLFSEEVGADPDGKGARILSIQRALGGRLAAMVRRGQETGRIRSDLPAEDVAFTVFGLVISTAVLYYLSGWRADIFARVEANQRLLESCMGTAGKGD